MVRGNHRKHSTIRTHARGVRAAGVWLSAGAALIACVVSGWPQPVAAAAGQGPVMSLVISPAVQTHLFRLYAAYRQLPVTSLAPAPPGRVLGARLPRSGTDWALVHFEPSARAGWRAAAEFQDGAGTGIFTRPPGGAWKVAGLGGLPSGCAVSLPQAVRLLWHLPGCRRLGGQPAPPPPGPVTAGTSAGLVTIALAQVGVADNPPGYQLQRPRLQPLHHAGR